jgi:methylmalonyl-CoA mutase, N-terminal domain
MSPDGTMTGGILRGIEDGWFSSEIAEASFSYQQKLEKGDKRVVGVNAHTETVEKPIEILRVSHEVEVEQVRELRARRTGRDQAAVDAALEAMLAAARSGANMIPPMIDAAAAEATLGEICETLRGEWGSYFEVPAF